MKKWKKGLLSVAVAVGLIILTACSLVAKEQLEELAKSYNKLKGVKDQLVYGEDSVTEKVVVDYTVVDMAKAMELTGTMTDDGDFSKGVSLKSSIKLLKEQGFKEKK